MPKLGTTPPAVAPAEAFNSTNPPSGASNGTIWTNPANNLQLMFQNGSWVQANVGASATGVSDNTLLTIGTDSDEVLVNRASVLNANTTLAGVVVGTPVTPAVAANSLIIANITADGDILLAAQTGGNTTAYLWIDASAQILRLYGGAGIANLVIDGTDVNLPNNIILTFGTGGDVAMVDKSTSTLANTAVTSVILGTPVTPAVAADSLLVFNTTNDGDILVGTTTGGNSQAAIWVDGSAGEVRLYGAGTLAVIVGATAVTFSVAPTPTANDGVALGVSGTAFADLFLASGAVINFAAANATQTHSTGLLTSNVPIVAAGFRSSGAAHVGLGAGEAVTLVSGVATVTKPYVILDAEGAGTTDTLDSITNSGQAAGDLLLLTVNATDTITADNSATLLLGAATRAIAPGGCLLLYATSATVWVELAFLAATS